MRPSTRRTKRSGRERPHPPGKGPHANPAVPAADGELERQKVARDFGRHSAERDHAVPTDLGCADCRGVLYVAELGKSGWLSFRCRIGHAYSADSLLLAKEDQLEESLWGTIEVLEELVQLYGVVMLREQASPDEPRRAAFRGRLEMARRHLRTLRGLIRSEGPEPTPARRRTHARK